MTTLDNAQTPDVGSRPYICNENQRRPTPSFRFDITGRDKGRRTFKVSKQAISKMQKLYLCPSKICLQTNTQNQ